MATTAIAVVAMEPTKTTTLEILSTQIFLDLQPLVEITLLA